MKHNKTCPRLVFDYIRSPRKRLEDVSLNEAPRESLLGIIQLKERGWSIDISDDRWSGSLGTIRARMQQYVELPSVKTLLVWRKQISL